MSRSKFFLGKSTRISATALCLLAFGACSTEPPIPQEVTIVAAPAPVPPGVVRYCWEEPMVKLENNGPGLDEEGKWYHPSYVAVREVRSGKWRPCVAVPDEVAGETRNER